MFQTRFRSLSFSLTTKRFASTVIAPSDPKLVGLIKRLEDFNKETKIFEKLDELHLLSQRKGFFNMNSNNLEFLSNNSRITNQYNNLQHFNNLDRLFNNNLQSFAAVAATAAPTPLSVTSTVKNITINGSNSNSPHQQLRSITNRNIFSFNPEINKFMNLISDLAKNDYELQKRIKAILSSFENVDDYFFSYVLEFWLSDRNFRKLRAEKLKQQQEENKQVLKSNASV